MEELNISSKREVYKTLHEHGIVRDYDHCHTPIDRKKDFFADIDTEEKAYWLGFLYADGCVHSHNLGISLALHTKDIEHLSKLKQALNLKNKIQNVKGHNTKRLEFTDKQMHTDLIKQGCIPKKSLILKPPENVPDHLIRHFIRGLFDGDGSIYIRKTVCRAGFSIVGSKPIITWTKDVLRLPNKISEIKYSKTLDQITCFRISTSDNKKIKELYKYLYNDTSVCLERKKEMFKKACAVFD